MRRVEENHNASSLQLAKEVESQTGLTVSHDTIQDALQSNCKYGCRPRRKSLHAQKSLTLTLILEFNRAHAKKDENYWDSVPWRDETKINVFRTDGFKTMWGHKGE